MESLFRPPARREGGGREREGGGRERERRGERGEGEAGRGEGARDTDRAAEREREGASCFIHSLLKQTHVSFIIVTLNK